MPLTRRQALAGGAALMTGGIAWAQAAPPEVAAELPGARLQGQGRLRFLGLAVYDARLWTAATPVGEDDWARVPLALELIYARELVGRLIAERSLKEMRGVGEISEAQSQRWLAAMNSLFPDVKEKDRITGIHKPGESARFHLNGSFKGEVREADFARLFFGIWLSPRSSEPGLRSALLGRS